MSDSNGYGEFVEVEATPEQRAIAEINKLIEADFSTASLREFIENTERAGAQIESELDLKAELLILAGDAINANDPDERKNAFAELRNATKKCLEASAVKREKLPSPETIAESERLWLIEQWLPGDAVTILSGYGGMGKSRLVAQIAGKIACGWPGNAWENRESRPDAREENYEYRRKKVLVAAWEDDEIEFGRRLLGAQKSLGFMPYETVQENVEYIDMRGKGPIWGVSENIHMATRAHLLPVGIEIFQEAKEYGTDLLVLDPLAAAYGGNENDRASVREFMSYLEAWTYKNMCGILILAHPPKNDAHYSGSTDWAAAARAMWKLEPEKENEENEQGTGAYRLKVIKGNYIKPPRPSVTIEKDSRGVWRKTMKGETDGKKETEIDPEGIV